MVLTTDVTKLVSGRAEFLASREPFKELNQVELERVAASLVERAVPAGETVLVESGLPGTELYVVRDGAFELTHKGAVVAILSSGEVFGHPTLLTGLSPEFTTRARQDSTLYVISKDVALDVTVRLAPEAGAAFPSVTVAVTVVPPVTESLESVSCRAGATVA